MYIPTAHLYSEYSGSLSHRIDQAWTIYKNKHSDLVTMKDAQQFLCFAYDIQYNPETPAVLEYLMLKKQKRSFMNPEFIPGKSPHHLPFNPAKVMLTKTYVSGKSTIPNIEFAMRQRELLDVNENSKDMDRAKNTKEFSSSERSVFQVHIHDGLFKKHGTLADTSTMSSHGRKEFAAFTLNKDGELNLFNHFNGKDKILHSSLNAGVPIVMAGEIKIINGVLKAITTYSGHYVPTIFNVERIIEHFSKQNISFHGLEVISDRPLDDVLPEVKSKAFKFPLDKDLSFLTPAVALFKYEDAREVLQKEFIHRIKIMEAKLTTYNKKNPFSTKDNQSTLSCQRAKLAVEFESLLKQFRESFNFRPLKTNELAWKTKELKLLIDAYELKNCNLSKENGKKASNGKLAAAIGTFKPMIRHKELRFLEIEDPNRLKAMKTVF
ncbi:MAG: hypothetical protein H0U75_03485 [Legionella sp.]|nr:hypothetical protein [Legionella sp.]